MKCENCGAKVTNDEKFCPECGTPLKTELVPEAILNADPETSETFIYSEHLLIPSLLRFAGAIAIAVVIALSFRDIKFFFMLEKRILSSIFLGAVAVFLVFRGIAGIIQEKKCFLCITPERIYGKIPTGILDTKEINIPLAEIILIENSSELFFFRFFLFICRAELKISTKYNETKINASSKAMVEKIGKSLIRFIKKYK